jgi:hypothetical protein
MKSRIAIKLALTFVAIIIQVLPAISCGCPFPIGEGYLGIKGKVYEWVNAPADAESIFYHTYSTEVRPYRDDETTLEKMIEEIPIEIVVKPLGDVEIEVDSKESIQNIRDGKYYYDVISDEEGNFEETWSVYPGEYEILIKATKPSYKEVIKETMHDTGSLRNHVIVVVLVKQR